MKTTQVLLAGATGYLGRYIAHQLVESGYNPTLLVRNKQKAKFDTKQFKVVEAEVTQPDSLRGLFEQIDIVISTVGITRQKDGLTYMDVDYQANVNLIEEAKKHQVKKFIYVSVLNGDKLRRIKVCEAKEKLGDYLKSSGLNYCLVRPNGFFSDMGDFLKMAQGGKVYLFGDGKPKLNPIHGKDLAKVCVDAIQSSDKELPVGGPDLLSQNEIASLALGAYSKPSKIIYFPDWTRKLTLWLLRTFTSSKFYGPAELFLTTMAMDMSAPCYGEEHLKDFFKETVSKQQKRATP